MLETPKQYRDRKPTDRPSEVRTSSHGEKRSPIGLAQFGIIAMLLVLAVSGLVSPAYCAASVSAVQTAVPATLTPGAQVAVFAPRTGQWVATTFDRVKPGDEFTYGNRLYHVTDAGKAEMLPGIDTVRLADADRTYDKANHRGPNPSDVVQVLDKGMKVTGHAVLGTVPPGTRICFQGRAYDVQAGGSSSSVILVDTGIVSSRVVRAFVRHVNTLVDLTVRSSGGRESTITGTTEHPFYVPGVHDYVAMAKLAPGMVLKTASGSTVSVGASTQRHGAFTVHNFEVQDQHNYYVSAQGVLVHNMLCDQPGDYLAGKAPGQVAPGTRTLTGQYVNDMGRVEPWTAHYDEYGRLIGRTDYNAGNIAADIPDVHYHVYDYLPNMGGRMPIGNHIPGEYLP